jgi:hypothetical protein
MQSRLNRGAALAAVLSAMALATAGVSAAATGPSVTPVTPDRQGAAPHRPTGTPKSVRARLANRVAIAIPGPVRAGRIYNVVLSGVSASHATAYLFVDYAGCAATLAGERRRAAAASDSYGVRGGFSEVTGWSSSSAGTDHACAYLVAAGGHLLATTRRAYRVS